VSLRSNLTENAIHSAWLSRTLGLLACFLIIFDGGVLSWALDGRKLNSQYAVHHWSLEDGLPDNHIRAMRQDREGYLWLGTAKSGIVRYDGTRFRPWLAERIVESEIPIRSFCETKDGSLWVGTDGLGLWRIKGTEISHYTKQNGLPNDRVSALHEDRAGTLWIALGGRSLVQWASGELRPVALAEDGPLSVVSFFEDRQGGLWLAGDGLWLFEEGRFIDMRQQLGLRQQWFRAVCQGQDGSMWLGTTRGLLRIQGDKVIPYSEVAGVSDDQITALYLDRDGNIWIGSNSGLDRFTDGKFSRCLTRENAPYDLVHQILEDREGSLWIGTNGGLSRLREEKFSNLTTREGLLQNLIAGVVEGRVGDLWIATWTKGMARLKDGVTTIFDKQVGLPRDTMRCLHADPNGIIWAGSEQGGISQIGETNISTIGQDGELGGRRVVAIQDDPEGYLWLLVEKNALFRFREGTFFPFLGDEGFLGKKAQAIHRGVQDHVWIATEAGLNCRRSGRWSNTPYPNEIAGRTFRSIFEDNENNVWLCVVNGGLARFRDSQFKVYRATDGLLDDSPIAVLDDKKNNLWISCGEGVFRVIKDEFARLDRGEIKALTCEVFSEADGMASRRCSQVGFPLATKLQDGRLCFPTDRGVAIVDPDRLLKNPIAPSVAIDAVLLDQERVQPDQAMIFPAGTRNIEIHYGAVSLRAPEKVRFKYRLEGFEKDWIDAGSVRVARYHNLGLGDYRFHVIAANEDGVWNRDGAALAFVKRPLPHQTGWFYGLCGLLLALATWLIHRRKVDLAKKQFAVLLEERTRIARDLHDTLEQGLVGISMQLNLTAAKFFPTPGAAHNHLEKARYMLRHSMADARSAILNLRSNDSPKRDLHSEFLRIADELAIGVVIEFTISPNAAPPDLPLLMEDTLIRIAQEALTNAAKHGRAKTICINLIYGIKQLILRIMDDGCGFDASSAKYGTDGRYGLLGMRERTEKLGGELKISSAAGKGTIIEVIVPLGKSRGR
jgi:signal transduction histidine kinase/ligand-binding sensor domain-containing protein